MHALTASPLGKGLFQRAIEQSGSSVTGVGLMGAARLANSEQNGVRLVEAKGAKTVAELRAMTWQQVTAPVQAPAGAAGRGAAGLRFSLVVDGYFLPAPVDEIFSEGKQNDVPELTGLNANDLGITSNANATVSTFEQQAKTRYSDLADGYLKAYPVSSGAQAVQTVTESSRDQARMSMYLWATNRAKTARTKAYTYYWNHTLPGPDAGTYGAFHTSEVPYALNTLYMSDRPLTAADHKIADTMSSYWTNFAATGDPNGKGLPHWPAVSEKTETTMQIGDGTSAIPVAGSRGRMEFWREYFARPRTAPTGRGAR